MKNKKGQEDFPIYVFLFIALTFGSLIVMAFGFDMVNASHLGVMNRFGVLKGTMQPGLMWTGLFTSVEPYDMRLRKDVVELSGDNSAVSKDGQAVYATINVNYRIKNDEDVVLRLYREVGTDDIIEDKLNIKAIITEGVKQISVKYDWIGILENREKVKEEIIEAVKSNFPVDYFVIDNIVVTNIGFSPKFQMELEEKQVATQSALKEQNRLEEVKFKQQQEIEVYKAEAEKMRLQKSELTSQLIQQQWIAKWDGRLPAYMISTPDNMGALMQLPLAVQAKEE